MRSKFVMITIAGVIALAITAAPQSLTPSAEASPCFSPMTNSEGGSRCDVTLLQSVDTNQLSVSNATKHLVTVTYSDPTYGQQSASVASLQDNRDAIICADRSYDALVTVTFDADTASPATFTGHYGKWSESIETLVQKTQAELARDVHRLAVARKKLVHAKRHRQAAKVKRLKARIRQYKVIVRSDRVGLKAAQAQTAYCDSRRTH